MVFLSHIGGETMSDTSQSALISNQYLIFIKDWWLILAAIGGGVFFMIKQCMKFIKEINKVAKIETDVETTKKDTSFIKGKVTTIEKLLTSMFSGTEFAKKYGIAHSPIVLKDELRRFITESQLDKQIAKKENDLVKWLKAQKPKTGLDAQEDIANLVVSNEILKYLDLTQYRQNLYQQGKTSEDALGILGVYLFEVLIPKLNLPDGNEEKK